MKVLKKADIILFVVILIVGIVAAFAPLWFNAGKTATKVVVTSEGKLYGEYSLGENREVLVTNRLGENHIIIENGAVYVDTATCDNKICVNTGKITKRGQVIACLPNKVIVTIEGVELSGGPDVII